MPAGAATGTGAVRAVGGVIDYAALFTPDERRTLEIEAGQFARRIETDFFVVSVDDRSALWADKRSHFAMVEKAFSDIQAAVFKHFGREAPLTVLMIFKSSVVIHLKTSDDALTERLLFRNFFRGADGALERIRRPGEAYGSAAAHYLMLFARTLDEFAETSSGDDLKAFSEQARFWGFQREALISSRKLIQQPFLDPVYKVLITAINLVTRVLTSLSAPGWIAFLLAASVLLLVMNHASSLISTQFERMADAVGDRLKLRNGEHLGAIGGHLVGDFVTKGIASLIILLMFAVSQGDLENILYISQVFDGEVLTYLDWSRNIARHDFALPVAILPISALLSAGTYALHCWYKFQLTEKIDHRSILEGLVMYLYLLFRLFITICIFLWILSLVIWPGIMATTFILASLLNRIVELMDSHVHFTKVARAQVALTHQERHAAIGERVK